MLRRLGGKEQLPDIINVILFIGSAFRVRDRKLSKIVSASFSRINNRQTSKSSNAFEFFTAVLLHPPNEDSIRATGEPLDVGPDDKKFGS